MQTHPTAQRHAECSIGTHSALCWSLLVAWLCSGALGALGLGRLGRLGRGGAVVGREALLEELLLKLVEVRACRLGEGQGWG